MPIVNSGSFTAGGFTVSGFDIGATYFNNSAPGTDPINFGYNGAFFAPTFDAGGPTVNHNNNFLWNWTSPTDGLGVSDGPEVITATGAGTSWSLHVQLHHQNVIGGGSFGNEELMVGSVAADGLLDGAGAGAIDQFGADGAGVTFTSGVFGTGAANLATLFKSLHINTSQGSPDGFAVSFALTDVTAAVTTDWTEYFAACYASGTRIAVPSGEVAVEDLRIGDLVMTSTGAAKPVKWLGYRSYTAAVAAANPHVRSVLVRKDAIAPGMPHRDLSLSPMHALFIDDAFIPAAALVNGVSILRNDDLAPVTYVHVEMDGHDVIFAEGQPAETYVDDNSRQMFDNVDEYHALYGADQGIMMFSAPRIEEGIQLEALRRRIAARAGLTAPAASTGKLQGHVERLEDGVLHGWVFDTATPSNPVELEVLVDGEVIATAIANRYRVDLDFHGLAAGRAGFTVTLPASVTSMVQVSVRRTTDRAGVAMPQVALVD